MMKKKFVMYTSLVCFIFVKYDIILNHSYFNGLCMILLLLGYTSSNDPKFNTGGISISQNVLSKGLEIAKARAKLVRSVIDAAISTLNVKDMEINT